MKKFLIGVAAVLLSGSIAVIASAQQSEKQNPRPDYANKPSTPEIYSNPEKSANYLYPDNSNKKENQLVKKESVIKGQIKKGLNLKNIKLVKYSEYLTDKKNRGGDIVENYQVHPNRLIYFVEIDAPDGLEIPQKNGQNLKFKKSSILQVYDAETGELFSTDIAETK